MTEKIDYVFCALGMICLGRSLAGIAKIATDKACSECKTLDDWTWTVSRYSAKYLQ